MARMLSISPAVKCVGGSLEGTSVPTIVNLRSFSVEFPGLRPHARQIPKNLVFRNISIAASSCVGDGGHGWMSGEGRGV